MSRRGIRFQAKMLELVRKYSWTIEKRAKLYKDIELSPNHVVVDVGCGTGAFTRVIAQGLDHAKGGRVIGIDRNQELLKTGRRLSSGDKAIAYKKGDVTKSLPLSDGFADRVVCQAFLWLFDDKRREKVIKEMIRVCKPGGLVAASEGAIDSTIDFFDGEPRLVDLWRKRSEALVSGFRKVYGYDRNLGYRLPAIFKELGLGRVRLDVYPYTDGGLLCDDRVPLEHKLDVLNYWELRYPTTFLSKVRRCKTESEREHVIQLAEPALIAGGMSYDEVIELMQLRRSRARKLLGKPVLVSNDASVAFGVGFLTSGIKPQVN